MSGSTPRCARPRHRTAGCARLLLVRGEHLDGVAPNAELVAGEAEVVALVLQFDEAAQDRPLVALLAHLEHEQLLGVLLGRAEAVDRRHGGDDDDVAAAEQRARRRVAQPVDLVVDRAVLLDVGIGRRQVRLGLVIVVVETKYSTRFFGNSSRNSAASCAARLLFGAITSVGRLAWAITLAIANDFPDPVMPSSVWKLSPRPTPLTIAAIDSGWSPAGARSLTSSKSGIRRWYRVTRQEWSGVSRCVSFGFFAAGAAGRPRPGRPALRGVARSPELSRPRSRSPGVPRRSPACAMRRSASCGRDAALLEPVQAVLLRRFDDDHRVVLEAALRLDQQGDVVDHDAVGRRRRDLAQELLADRRVRDRLEILLRFVGSERPARRARPGRATRPAAGSRDRTARRAARARQSPVPRPAAAIRSASTTTAPSRGEQRRRPSISPTRSRRSAHHQHAAETSDAAPQPSVRRNYAFGAGDRPRPPRGSNRGDTTRVRFAIGVSSWSQPPTLAPNVKVSQGVQ